MEKLKNERVLGFRTKSFVIVKDYKHNDYRYYIRNKFHTTIGQELIKVRASKTKVKALNKYTLTTLCVLLNTLVLLTIPFVMCVYAVIMYIAGAKRFFTDSAYIDCVRFFNYTNIVAVVVLSIILTLNQVD